MIEDFKKEIAAGYNFKGDSIILGGAMLEGIPNKDLLVQLPLKTLNRHGLIAGATGTGKTKTLQGIAESLSQAGVPSLLMDLKGDLSGLAASGNAHPKITQRHESIGVEWMPESFPVELLTISNDAGVRLRATITEFGPVLFSRILELNDTQSGVVSLVFKYCDDNGLPLLDIKDFKKVMQFLTNEGKQAIEKEYGRISTASVATILRKIITIEEQGADVFFGERSFDVDDLTRINANGSGYINIIRLTDIQDKPNLFSTFVLSLLAEIYTLFPEEGDLEKPKLVIFIDEAHLLFKEASKALLSQIETIIKLIRSKGVGVIFCTQLPTDVPESILSQLGLKVQHALRAFTAKDRKNIKLTVENYPLTQFYDVDDLITNLGIGEALITGLNEKGIPTPLVHTMLCAPRSRMDVLNESEILELTNNSKLVKKYNDEIDRESAYEILNKKLSDVGSSHESERSEVDKKRSKQKEEKSLIEEVINSPGGRVVLREVTRSIMGILGIKGKRR